MLFNFCSTVNFCARITDCNIWNVNVYLSTAILKVDNMLWFIIEYNSDECVMFCMKCEKMAIVMVCLVNFLPLCYCFKLVYDQLTRSFMIEIYSNYG